ncbi:paraquat-inducible protein A [Prochlorothrix hollandica]|uniref:paraquat-inducible protein A n=1 Tax=Prochlorothrix hollandica TaxID=1223 RepID=UPI000345A3B6|nr:paraquat-inducible protein A [Prochlorothrix hollandica]
MNRKSTAFILSLIAAFAFGGALVLPFTSSDFEVHLPQRLESTFDTATDPCDVLDRPAIPPLLRQQCRQRVQGSILFFFDRTLGPVTADPLLTWGDCINLAQDAGIAEPWRQCAKEWIVTMAAIPVGQQRLLFVIEELRREGELPLASLLLIFSIFFPLTKVALCLWLGSPLSAPRPSRGWLKFLTFTSKWSMTDVFVVALIIVFFKAESFNFHVEAELGAYCFAMGAILSSIAAATLEAIPRSPSPSVTVPEMPIEVARE